MKIASASAVLMALALLWPGAAAARVKLGQPLPGFQLRAITGQLVSQATLKGRPAVLVVGRTQKAAPPCKRWMVRLLKQYGNKGVQIYQVIVVDKAWYLPRGLVMKRIIKFVGINNVRQVLVEWNTRFADVYGIALHDLPTVIAADPKGVVRWVHKGRLSKQALAALVNVLPAKRARRK